MSIYETPPSTDVARFSALVRASKATSYGLDVPMRSSVVAACVSFKFRTHAKWPIHTTTYRSVGLRWPDRKVDWVKGGQNRRNQQCPVFSKHLWPLASWQPFPRAPRQPKKLWLSIPVTSWLLPSRYTTASYKTFHSASVFIRRLTAACHPLGGRQGPAVLFKHQRSQ